MDFLKAKFYSLPQIILKFVTSAPTYNVSAVVRVMAWRPKGDPDHSRHMAALGHNKLAILLLSNSIDIRFEELPYLVIIPLHLVTQAVCCDSKAVVHCANFETIPSFKLYYAWP